MSGPLYVNGRFSRRPVTGVERVAEEVLARLDRPFELVLPPGRASGGAAGHLWEQAALPRRAPGVLWSPCNTGPVRHPCHVVTIHDVAAFHEPRWFSPAFARTYRWMTPRLCRRAQAVVTVSTAVADELLGLGATADRLHVIENGVSGSWRPAGAAEVDAIRRRLRLGERPYVVAVGSPEPRKNLDGLLQAWGDGIAGADLLLVGEASPRVFGSVDRPSSSTVRALGRLADDDLRVLVGGAAAMASVSWYEGFGLPPVEALACGTPVVASDIAAHRATVAPFGAVLVDPADPAAIRTAIRNVLTDPPGVDDEAVRRRYSWASAARAYDGLFGELEG